MAQYRMGIPEVVFDDAAMTCSITFRAVDPPPPPDDPDFIDWYPREALTVTATFPVRRRDEIALATGIGATVDESGARILTRYTWNGSSWVNPVPVDHQDQPLP